MISSRRSFALALILAAPTLVVPFAVAQELSSRPTPEFVLRQRYRLVLDLVRHTATYSPPVASRAFAYFGVIAYEATASGRKDMATLVGQLNGLSALPKREPGQLTTRPSSSTRALSRDGALLRQHRPDRSAGDEGARRQALAGGGRRAAAATSSHRSAAYGLALTEAVSAWADADNTGPIENMGFPLSYALKPGPDIGSRRARSRNNRRRCCPTGARARPSPCRRQRPATCPRRSAFSADKDSAFYREALEVHDTGVHLDDEQKAIARFWSDDAMLSTTPPGHWIQIAFQMLDKQGAPIEQRGRPARAARRRDRRRLHRLLDDEISSTIWFGPSPTSAPISTRPGRRS